MVHYLDPTNPKRALVPILSSERDKVWRELVKVILRTHNKPMHKVLKCRSGSQNDLFGSESRRLCGDVLSKGDYQCQKAFWSGFLTSARGGWNSILSMWWQCRRTKKTTKKPRWHGCSNCSPKRPVSHSRRIACCCELVIETHSAKNQIIRCLRWEKVIQPTSGV